MFTLTKICAPFVTTSPIGFSQARLYHNLRVRMGLKSENSEWHLPELDATTTAIKSQSSTHFKPKGFLDH